MSTKIGEIIGKMSDEVAGKTKDARDITHDAVNLASSSQEKVDTLDNAANEIKELARQTADATGEIRSKIDSIQYSTGETVIEIRQINEVINKVDAIVADIAVSVEEQSATTSEISENVIQAAQGIVEVNENVAQSSTVADSVAQDITDVSQSATALAQNGSEVEASRLQTMIMQFKIDETKMHKRRVQPTANIPDLMPWGPDIKIGIKRVVDQHKVLVRMINDLHKAMKTRQGKPALEKIMSELVDYTVMHFGREEKLFAQYGYQEEKEHKAIHKKIVDQVLDYQKRLIAGDPTVSINLMTFLKDWLTSHIKGIDTEYVPFMKEHGIN